MFWIGIIIGLVIGGCVALIGVVPLVDRLDVLEAQGIRYKAKLDEALAAVQRYERDNAWLASDLKQMERLVSPEDYARFFDAPYKS